jgi:hypothetical protein
MQAALDIEKPATTSIVRVVCMFLLHSACWIPLLLVVAYAGRVERVYREFEVRVPVATQFMLDSHGLLFVLAMVLFLAVDAAALVYLERRGRLARILWTLTMVAVPIVSASAAATALLLPMFQMMESLSK